MSSIYQDAWDKAWHAFEVVRAEVETYDRAVWRPAYDAAQAGGPPIPKHIDASMQRLVDAQCQADEAIIATPAPDLTTAIWKLDYARERWADCEDLPQDWWKAIMSDLHRLETAVQAPQTTWRNNLEAWQLAHKQFHEWRGPDDVPSDLCDTETATWRKMLDTPAPDLPALRIKLEQLLKVDGGVKATNAWDADEVRQTIADVARLLADA